MSGNNTEEAIYIDVFSTENPAFCSYLICVSLLALKMLGTILLTVIQRIRTKTYISSEDAAWRGGEIKCNEDVERPRRAYQNDMETIPLFCIISLGYLWTKPSLCLINILFILYLISRVCHTIVYAIYVIRQPARAMLWTIGIIILTYMSVHTALFAFMTGYL